MRKTRKQIKQLRQAIKELRESEDNPTFQEIADTLGLKSHQLARYHYEELTKLEK